MSRFIHTELHNCRRINKKTKPMKELLMSNVVQFPAKEKALWDAVVAGVTEPTTRAGATEDQVEKFLKQFKPTFEKFLFEYQMKLPSMPESLAAEITEEMNKFEKALQDYSAGLVMERLMREIETFDWRNS